MGTTSSAPARDSRGDLRQRAAQQAQQPRYTMPQGYANAPQPFQGQQNYAAPRYYGQVRARPPAVPPKNPPRRETLAWHAHASQPGAFFRRVALECVEHPARHRGGRREDISHLLFSRLASASRAPSVLRASLRLFRRKKCVRVFPTDPFSTHITHVHARMHTRTHSPHRSKRRCPRSARRARRRFATT